MSVHLNEARQKLKAKLKWGDQARICKMLGMTKVAVYRILKGDWDNENVWEAVAMIVKEHDTAERAIIKAAENLSC